MLFCAILVLGSIFVFGPGSAAADNDEYSRDELETDRQRVEQVVEKYGITEALGPLAPVAMSPFFGLACLSGTSILCDWGWLPANDFLQGNEVLNNPLVFLLFAGLTVLTSVPKLVSVSKVFAEAADRVETYAGIISYAVILLAAQQAQPEQEIVYTAGFIALTHNGLLACMAAVNIFVISTVRLFFELLVLISPVPTLDAIFEISNKTLAGILMTLYIFDPYLAFVVNVIIFLLCLVIFRWVNRRLRYYKAVLLEPIWATAVHRVLGRENYHPDWKVTRVLNREIPGIDMVVKVFPSRRLGKIRKKDRCYLVFAGAHLSLVRPHILKVPLVRALDPAAVDPEIKEGLAAYWLELHENGRICELIFGRVYTDKLDIIQDKLREFKAIPSES